MSRLVHGRSIGLRRHHVSLWMEYINWGDTIRCCQCTCWYAGFRHLCAMLSCVFLQNANKSAPSVTSGVASTMRTPNEVPQRNCR